MSGPFYRDIETAEAALEAVRHDYLRRWGWNLTCNTPGSYWLWQRDFRKEDRTRRRRWRERKPGPLGKPSAPKPYGLITASTDLAVSMTVRALDEQLECVSDVE